MDIFACLLDHSIDPGLHRYEPELPSRHQPDIMDVKAIKGLVESRALQGAITLGLPRSDDDGIGNAPEAIRRCRLDTAEQQQRAHEAIAQDARFRGKVAAVMEKANTAQA